MSSMWKKKWTSDMLNKFVLKYEQFPVLWDCTREVYKNRECKEQGYQGLVKALSKDFPGIDVLTVKAKIRSLRNAYTLELHKIVKSKQSGATSPDEVYKPMVRWFAVADRFLRRVVVPRPTAKSIMELYAPSIMEDEELENSENSYSIPEPSVILDIDEKPPKNYLSSYITDEMKIKTEDDNNSTSTSSNIPASGGSVGGFNNTKDIADDRPADFYETFGKLVAGYMRQLPQNVALQCQSHILNLLIDKCKMNQCYRDERNNDDKSVDDDSPLAENADEFSEEDDEREEKLI